MIAKEMIEKLMDEALEAQKFSYSPYSSFQVGAALLSKSNKIYRGCNIENVAFGPTNCAERTAFFKAVSEGDKEFTAIAIVGNPKGKPREKGDYCSPCGVCRQVMAEFCKEDFLIILGNNREDYKVYTLSEILPLTFTKTELKA